MIAENKYKVKEERASHEVEEAFRGRRCGGDLLGGMAFGATAANAADTASITLSGKTVKVPCTLRTRSVPMTLPVRRSRKTSSRPSA